MSNRSTSPTSLVRKAVAVEIALLRTPLVLADRVATRLGAQDAVRPKLQQGMVLLDALAGALSRGADTPHDAEPFDAEQFDAEPTPRSTARPAVVPDVRPEPTQESLPDEQADEQADTSGEADEAELIEEVTEELLEEEEVAPHAGELADDDELRRVQAELNAKRLVAEQQESRPD